MCQGDQLPSHVHIGMHDDPQPPARVTQGNKQDMLQLLDLPAWVWMAGCQVWVQADWDMEACATHNRRHLLWGSSGNLGLGTGEGPW